MTGCFVRFRRRFVALPLAWLALAVSAFAQTQRDPTVPPPMVGMPAPGVDAPTGLVLVPGQMTVLQRDGVFYLVLGTRMYAPGQTVGSTKIERITETEVWLQDNGSVRQVPVFGGITRRAVAEPLELGAPPPATSAAPARPAADWQPGPEFEL